MYHQKIFPKKRSRRFVLSGEVNIRESDVQSRVVSYHRLLVDPKDAVLFAVPNGERRDKAIAARLQEQGVMSGVSDLILVCQKAVVFIEVKRPKTAHQRAGALSGSQKEFSESVSRLGHPFRTIRSLEEYLDILREFGVATRNHQIV